jgi:cyclase
MEQITKNVFVETSLRGCNPSFVVNSKGIILIDTPIDLDYAKVWATEIAKRGKILYTINTEHHLDHWLYNSFYDGTIISQQDTREAMMKMDVGFIRKRIQALYIDPIPFLDNHELRLPNITYTEHMTLYLGEHTFHLIHTPGHTLGQTAIYIPEEKIVFTGDNVFGQKRTAIHTAVLDKWLESLKVLEKLDFRLIVPGHGSVCEKGYLRKQASIIQGLLDTAKRVDGVNISEEVRRRIDPFYGTRDIGLIP